MRMGFASFCLVIVLAVGCTPQSAEDRTAELVQQIEALKSRVQELDRGSKLNEPATQGEVPSLAPSDQNAIFADSTYLVEAGDNVLIDFATRNYASDDPSHATTQLIARMSYYTLKRLKTPLELAVQRHSSIFGETSAREEIGKPEVGAKTETIYANFARITATPESLFLDLGISTKPPGAPLDANVITNTVVIDMRTATTLLEQITQRIDAYEAKNGPIETDIQKRLKK